MSAYIRMDREREQSIMWEPDGVTAANLATDTLWWEQLLHTRQCSHDFSILNYLSTCRSQKKYFKQCNPTYPFDPHKLFPSAQVCEQNVVVGASRQSTPILAEGDIAPCENWLYDLCRGKSRLCLYSLGHCPAWIASLRRASLNIKIQTFSCAKLRQSPFKRACRGSSTFLTSITIICCTKRFSV